MKATLAADLAVCPCCHKAHGGKAGDACERRECRRMLADLRAVEADPGMDLLTVLGFEKRRPAWN